MADWARYNDLQIDPAKQIRVLTLESGHGDKPLSGHLSIHELSDSSYEALSYTWGDSSRGETITINGQSGFPVTDNLFDALRRLRRKDEARVLWIDAICINQANIHEQSSQVQLMREVYRDASRVLIWLGDADEPASVDRSPFKPLQMATRGNKSSSSDATDRMMRSYDAAIALTTPQWWTRTWIIQEVVLAKTPIVCFGEYELSWHDVGLMREEMSAMMEATRADLSLGTMQAILSNGECAVPGSFGGYVKRYQETNFDGAYQVLDTLRTHDGTWAGLSELASITARSEASDPRDRVFGYYGLWSGSDQGLLSVSYEKATAEVYADATFADMQAERNLVVLNLVRPQHAHRQGLPTWTLDFSFKDIVGHLPVVPKASQRSTNLPRASLPTMSKNSRRLTLEVTFVDRISTVHPLPSSSSGSASEDEKYLPLEIHTLPTSDAYALLRHRFTKVLATADLYGSSPPDIACQRMPSKVDLAERLGVQTDLVSDIFLWWLLKAGTAMPRKDEFSDLYEWWKTYAHYQCDARGVEARKSASVFYCTELGFIGKGLTTTRPGDNIVFIRGLDLPAIIRQVNEDFILVGLTWLNGAMMGEMDDILDAAAQFDHVKRITLV